jgi:ABC-2 type transport system permease protein
MGLIWLAALLASRRDFGTGMVAPKPGPARAAPWLASPLGLAVRLHRGVVIWWAVGVVALGIVYGSLTASIGDFIADNPTMEDLLAALGRANLTDSYLATSVAILALTAAGPALQILARLRGEESDLRVEPLLATPVSRSAWVASHFVVALAGSALILGLAGAGVGAAYAVTGGGVRQIPRLFLAALVYVPAVWLLAALAVALFGVVPRWTAGAWVALSLCFTIAMFGALLDLPAWALDLSPFQHIPGLPAESVRVFPLAAVTAIAAGLTAVGLFAFRSRDVVTA